MESVNQLSRNKRIARLFSSNGYNVRVLGYKDDPYVVLEERYLLPCVVNNWKLLFLKSIHEPTVLKTIALDQSTGITQYELDEILTRCEFQKVYSLQLEGTDMKLVGYNHSDENDYIPERFPVFGCHRPIVFFNHHIAMEKCQELSKEGYKISIVEN